MYSYDDPSFLEWMLFSIDSSLQINFYFTLMAFVGTMKMGQILNLEHLYFGSVTDQFKFGLSLLCSELNQVYCHGPTQLFLFRN